MGTASIRISDRLGLAKALIERFAPQVKAKGSYQPATALQPDMRSYKHGEIELTLTEKVLLLPVDPATSSLLDVWGYPGKLFSVNWMPERPLLPPHISTCKPGVWILDLGLEEFVRKHRILG